MLAVWLQGPCWVLAAPGDQESGFLPAATTVSVSIHRVNSFGRFKLGACPLFCPHLFGLRGGLARLEPLPMGLALPLVSIPKC